MANYGIKISEAGYNVLTADLRRLILSSGLNMFKVFSSGVSVVSATSTNTISHDLGYVPNFLVYMEDQDDQSETRVAADAEEYTRTIVSADNADLFIENTDGDERDALYFIMYDPA